MVVGVVLPVWFGGVVVPFVVSEINVERCWWWEIFWWSVPVRWGSGFGWGVPVGHIRWWGRWEVFIGVRVEGGVICWGSSRVVFGGMWVEEWGWPWGCLGFLWAFMGVASKGEGCK